MLPEFQGGQGQKKSYGFHWLPWNVCSLDTPCGVLLRRTQLPCREKASPVEGPCGGAEDIGPTQPLSHPSWGSRHAMKVIPAHSPLSHPQPFVSSQLRSHIVWSTDKPLPLFSAQIPDWESVSTINLNSSRCKCNCTCVPNVLKNSFSKKGWEWGRRQIPPNKHGLNLTHLLLRTLFLSPGLEFPLLRFTPWVRDLKNTWWQKLLLG